LAQRGVGASGPLKLLAASASAASGALDCAQFREHLSCASSIGSGVLIRINGGKAAVS